MFKFNSNKVMIDGRTYRTDKASYPFFPTVMSGVDIQWGAASCIEHPDPSRAQLSLWIPKTHEGWLPELGDVVTVSGLYNDSPTTTNFVSMFAGKIESVKLQDDHKALPASSTPYTNTAFTVTGWTFFYDTDSTPPGTNITSSVTLIDGNTFNVPITPDAVPNWLTATTPKFDVVAGGAYAFTWTTNNTAGVQGRARYFNAAGAEFTSTTEYSLKNRFDFNPPTGAVKAIVEFVAIMNSNYSPSFTIGKFFFESFVPGTEKPSGYKVAIVAADALAEAARLRLSDSPWPFESASSRQQRIESRAASSGVEFKTPDTDDQGKTDSFNTKVTPRDVDSAPALEIFQRTCLAAGHTVISADNAVQPSYALKLPTVLTPQFTSPTKTTFEWTGLADRSTSVMKVNGVVTRTNHATNPSSEYTTNNYSVFAGTGGSAYIAHTGEGWANSNGAVAVWNGSANSGTTPYVSYKETTSGAINTKVSAGVVFKISGTSYAFKDVQISVILWNGTTAANTVTGPVTRVDAEQWTYLKVNNVNATTAYTAIEIRILPLELVTAGWYVMVPNEAIFVDGVLIEKAATAGKYFDGYWLAKDNTVLPEDKSNILTITSSQIEDDVFEIDTSKVVNEVKAELKLVSLSSGSAVASDYNQILTDQLGSKKTTPQTRSLDSDWAIEDTSAATDLPASVMMSKVRLLLTAQSRPQWRLSGSMNLVLDEVDDYAYMEDLLNESTRFGALITLNNGPSRLPKYFRAHAGRIVLAGDDTQIEFDVEPVDYSAPVPLTRNTLRGDANASYTLIGNLKNITSNNLRSIGAR